MATDPMSAPPAAVAAPGAIASTPEERQQAMIAHWGGMLPFFGFLFPLGLYAAKMGESPFVEDQAKESLNMQILVLMLSILFAISIVILIGFVLLPSLLLVNGIYCFMAGAAAKEGKLYRYPYIIRIIQ
jgi:uncharacterized Tic20 family protein